MWRWGGRALSGRFFGCEEKSLARGYQNKRNRKRDNVLDGKPELLAPRTTRLANPERIGSLVEVEPVEVQAGKAGSVRKLECNHRTYSSIPQRRVGGFYNWVSFNMSEDIKGLDPGDRYHQSRGGNEKWSIVGWEEPEGDVRFVCTALSGVVRGDSKHLIKIRLWFTRKRGSRCCRVARKPGRIGVSVQSVICDVFLVDL